MARAARVGSLSLDTGGCIGSACSENKWASRSAFVGIALVLCSGLFAAVAASAEAETQHYNSDMSFSSYSQRTEYGTRDADGGCEFGGEFFPESGADSLALGAEELSYDPDTCTSVYRVGHLREGWGDSPPESGGVTVDDSGTESTPGLQEPPPPPCRPWFPCESKAFSAESQSSTTSSTQWYPRKELYSSIAWEDPFQLDVNKTEVWLNFKSTDSCAGAGRVYSRRRHYWLSETGWSRTHDQNGREVHCTYVARWNNGRFVNDRFCDIIGAPYFYPQTRTRMWPNRAIGLPRGRHKPWQRYSKAGGCSSFLHAETKWKIRRVD
jgi:hypothetical protein